MPQDAWEREIHYQREIRELHARIKQLETDLTEANKLLALWEEAAKYTIKRLEEM
jgi:hypothetical protein